MLVSELLAQKGSSVHTVRTTDSVREAVHLLHDAGVGALVVSDDGRVVDGIVSERDVVREMHLSGTVVFDLDVSILMSCDVQTCGPDDQVDALAELMTAKRIRHIPVVRAEGGEMVLAGIISIGDVVKERIAKLELDRFELLEYVSAR